jgi:pyruvate carboxylase
VSPDGDTAHKMQFELNGQSRFVRVALVAADAPATRPLADPGNLGHIAAPMPGAIVGIAVAKGQRVSAGSALLAMEAMKMETHVTADRDAEVEQVLVEPGDHVQAKDLVLVLRPL